MPRDPGYVIFLLLLLPYTESVARRRLNEYISHYEPLRYEPQPVRDAHARVRRSTEPQHVHVHFRAHGQRFHLRLKRDLSSFSSDLKVEGSKGETHNVDTSHIYHGELLGDRSSTVFGSLVDGVFEGKIMSRHGSYYVEKAKHYFPHDHNDTFHSVIYKEQDVSDPYAHVREGHVGGCGINDDVIQWMEKIQNSAVEDDTDKHRHSSEHRTPHSANSIRDGIPKWKQSLYDHPDSFHFESGYRDIHNRFKYSREANEGHHYSNGRQKRATRPKEDNRNTCSLYIQTDPLIWRHIREGFPDHRDHHKKSEIDEKTREEILSLIAHHVTAVNYIYRDTKFDGRIEHRNIKFEVQRIKIDDDSACNPNQFSGELNQFCLENIDVSNFLNLHSLGNHEDFCLAYVFTYRDFTGGTLGLAWVASASGASGGICEKYKTYTETIGGMYQSTKRSLNTGIITFVNYNSRVPPKVSQLTLAHEIGHNFGSPHDYPNECRPGGLNGNYIMFASATSGDRPNNSKFSACSVGNISNVLDAMVDNKKRNCFTASAGAFCGNKIVEAGEECDCGYDDEECTERCCYPRILSDIDKLKNDTAKGCNRKYATQCSPSQGPCCTPTCHFLPASERSTCRTASDCALSSMCDGRSPECPSPKPMPDKTRCNNGTQLCIRGDCAGSICLEWNLNECFLTSNIIPNINKRKLCELACQNGSDPSTCRSTSEFASAVGLPPGGISLRPGSPCDNFQGYCDVFLKCRAVDAEGPLVRLKNLLLNRQTLLSVAQWVTEYWWAVLLLGVGFVVCMGLFIKCCAVHTPSSNPKQPPARRLSETLRRPMNTLRRMRRGQYGPTGPGPNAPSRDSRGSRPPPGASRRPQNPHRGYQEGRASAPAPSSGRGSSGGRGELYAGAYSGPPNSYEMRSNKV
ncbi:zinc-dependent metalloprotease kuz isoform X2 [Arctopsyche grandis]|uniref:zinc-dependent metalloprotease kuz isoform X2 n=1 Tax=Arctopsyche grandis TaxID=121162 RepID=UPI00406DA050